MIMPPKEPKAGKRRVFICPECKGLPADLTHYGSAQDLGRHLKAAHGLNEEEIVAFKNKYNEELHFLPPEKRGHQKWCMLCHKRLSKLSEHLMGPTHKFAKTSENYKKYSDLAKHYAQHLKRQMREGGGAAGGQQQEDTEPAEEDAEPAPTIPKKQPKKGKLLIKTFLTPCKTCRFSRYLESASGKSMKRGAPYTTHVTIILNTIYTSMMGMPISNTIRGRPRHDARTNVDQGLYECDFTYKNIHDHWFDKLYSKEDETQTEGPNPHTIKLRLESLWKFTMFLEYIRRENKTIIKEKRCKEIQIDIKQYIGSLSKRLTRRGTEIQEESLAKAPTLEEIDTFFKSAHVRSIKALINSHKNKRCEDGSSFVQVRNYLMTQLLFDNAQRPAPIASLTIAEFEKVLPLTKGSYDARVKRSSDKVYDVRVIDASRDKTAYMYGKVKLVVRNELYDFLQIYRSKFRPKDIEDKIHMFVTDRPYGGQRVSTMLLHQAVQAIWKKVHPGKDLTATSIRKVTVSTMFQYNPELATLLAELMGHSARTQLVNYDFKRKPDAMVKVAAVLHDYHQNQPRGKKRGRPKTRDDAAGDDEERDNPEKNPLTLDDPANQGEIDELIDEKDGYVDEEYMATALEAIESEGVADAAGPKRGVVEDGQVAGPSGVSTQKFPEGRPLGARPKTRPKNVRDPDPDSDTDIPDTDTYITDTDTYITDTDIPDADADTIADPDSDESYNPPRGKKMKLPKKFERNLMNKKHSNLLNIYLHDMLETGILPTGKVRERIANTPELRPLLEAYNADKPKYQAHIKILSKRVIAKKKKELIERNKKKKKK